RNHSRPHVFRVGLRHRPASQNRINADRLSHPTPPENLLDSIGTEHALDTRGSSDDGHWACNGFTSSTVSATGLRAVGPLFGPLASRILLDQACAAIGFASAQR